MTEKLRRSDEAGLGRFAERVWENIFTASGVRFIPLAKLDMGAPRVDGKEFVVLPDYQCAGDGWEAYIDSKCKSGPVFFRKKQQWRHGIDRKRWADYERTGYIFKRNAGLGVIELFAKCDNDLLPGEMPEWSGALLAGRFKELGPPEFSESRFDDKVYWRTKQFTNLDSLSPDELLAAWNGKPPRTYKMELTDIFAPQKQTSLFA